jgi:predicted PurR-regulated permease PerM
VREYLAAFPWIAVAWGVVACLYADEWLVVPFVVALMIGANSER